MLFTPKVPGLTPNMNIYAGVTIVEMNSRYGQWGGRCGEEARG
jgi:hypothetical protein